MARTRISTTVDAGRLERCRKLVHAPDSEMLDRALAALIAEVESEAELAAIGAHPYEDDADLAWEVEEGPPLPYTGHVPKEVLAMAKARKRRR